MFLICLYAFVAGLVTVLSPCVLPLLPVLLAGTSGGRWRPWGIVTGFVAGFVAFALGLTWLVQGAGLPLNTLRWVAGGALITFGLVMAIPQLQAWFQALVAPLAIRQGGTVRPGARGGFGSGLIVGLGLGLSWSPCVGPIMASVLTLALSQSLTVTAVAAAVSFSLGTATVFLAVMVGGRRLLDRVPWLFRHLESLQRLFGAIMVVAGLAILLGWDREFATWVLQTFPAYGQGLTAWEATPAVLDQVQALEP